MNADPVVLGIIIEHLQTISIFGLVSISASGCLLSLASGEQSLLNFAKAWHVLDMLRLPKLQNKLLKIYRTYYLKRLKRMRHCRQPSESKPIDSEPFVYLRNNMGNHSTAEKFLVDFHAGLMRNQRELRRRDFEGLPHDVATLIGDRWLQLCDRDRKDSHQSDFNHDRIAAGDHCYKVTQNQAIEHSIFQIQYLCGGSGGTFGLNPPLPVSPRTKRRKSSQTTLSSTSAGTRSSPGGSADPAKNFTQPRLENPFQRSTTQRTQRKHSASVSPGQVPVDHGMLPISRRSSLAGRSYPHKSRSRGSRQSSVSFALDLPSEAPFMSGSPSGEIWSHDVGGATATDEESVYDLCAPNLRWNDPPPDGPRELGTFSVLDFAA